MAKTKTSMEKAAEYISGELKKNPKAGILALIDEASMRFNLSPLQTQALTDNLTNKQEE